MRAWCYCLLGLFIVSFAYSAATGKYDIETILESVPEDERLQFLKYHIQLGFTVSRDETIENTFTPDLPQDFSVYLYKSLRNSAAIEDEDLLKQLREIVCFDDGVCIDLGDVGVHP